ncbi:MAG: cell division protein FtsZ, partial [Beijerinckiaceae bacterium]
GEATGDKRALMAAEAAIANPLLDEVSMKGAKGLLISITGGKDMMLYELDEAATRIREEVDPEANIILGATQDESLDGIIRVSVVATGIDRASIDAIEPVKAVDPRILEAAQRLRSQVAPRPVAPAVSEPVTLPLMRTAQLQPAPVEAVPVLTAPVETTTVETASSVETTESLAVPAFSEASLAAASASDFSAAIEAELKTVVDAEARGPVVRPARMPRVEDFPTVAQDQIRAAAQPDAAPAAPPAEARRMTLLQRLAAVGLGRRDDQIDEAEAEPAQAAASAARRPVQPQPQRAAAGQLDSVGRTTPRSIEDDQLEIPAFLRRQAN